MFISLGKIVCMFISLGVITIPDGMTFTVNYDQLNGNSPQFTLTCISTGGPATTVTWTRDSVTVTEGNETVLDNRATSQYTHTLTVTGRLGGLYTCTVANNRPSNNESSAQFTVQGTYNTSMVLQMKLHVSPGFTYMVTEKAIEISPCICITIALKIHNKLKRM